MILGGRSERYDVAIVGAGLAGLQCARLLGRAGFRVLLADAKKRVADHVHTTGIFVRRTLEDFDLPAGLLGPPIRRVAVYSPNGRGVSLESPREEFRVGRMGELYKAFLAESAGCGVEWRPEHRFVGLERDETGSSLVFETRGGPTRVRATVVIAADGALSPTAAALGLSRNREFIVGLEDVYRGATGSGAPQLHCFLDRRIAPGYLAWVVDDGEEIHVGVGGHADRFSPAEALQRFLPRIAHIVDVREAERVERRGGRIPVGGVLPHIANEWGLAVGDAAGAVSPLTAGGLDPCLRLSAVACSAVAERLRNGAGGMEGYDGRRFRSLFRSRLILRKVLSRASHPGVIELAFAALPGALFRSLAGRVFFGHGSFPDVGLSKEPRRRDGPGVPASAYSGERAGGAFDASGKMLP